jgi:teichuronic acid biosynthesis glycosyltransferase TuaG
MSRTPAISIITPAYNAQQWLPRLAESVLAQTFRDCEWIIVDDCSTDHTAEIGRSFALNDSRVRLNTLTENLGVANARNVGLRMAVGDYICFVDTDDFWHREKLETQYRFMTKRGERLTCMDYQRVSENGRLLSRVSPPAVSTFTSMLMSNRIGNLTGMVRRSDTTDVEFKRVGHEDYLFWLELVRKIGHVARVPSEEPLCFYTVRDSSISANKLTTARWQWSIYRSILQLGLIESLWYFCGYVVLALRKRR